MFLNENEMNKKTLEMNELMHPTAFNFCKRERKEESKALKET
jgi:hypothetical protein